MIPLLRALTSSRGPMPMFWRCLLAVFLALVFAVISSVIWIYLNHAR